MRPDAFRAAPKAAPTVPAFPKAAPRAAPPTGSPKPDLLFSIKSPICSRDGAEQAEPSATRPSPRIQCPVAPATPPHAKLPPSWSADTAASVAERHQVSRSNDPAPAPAGFGRPGWPAASASAALKPVAV